MGKLNQVADGVWVRQSEWVWTNSIAVRGEDGLILIDPGITGTKLDQLADDVDDPPRRPRRPARRRHALRRPDPALRPSPRRSGERLRDGTRPAGRGRQARRRRGPRPRRRRCGSRGGGPPRRRSRLHRRAATRRGTGRRASGTACGLALRPPPVEPGAGSSAVGLLTARQPWARGWVPPVDVLDVAVVGWSGGTRSCG